MDLILKDLNMVPLTGDVRTMIMDEAHTSKYLVHRGADKMCYDLRNITYGKKCLLRILWVEVGEGKLIGPKIVQEITKKISHIKDRLKAARDYQKSYVDKGRKPLEFSVGDHVLLKVSPWKGVVCFGKKGKLAPRIVGTFKITGRIEEIQVDAKLNFVEEPMEILQREFKKVKWIRIHIVKVRWNLKQGPEFTWERLDVMDLIVVLVISGGPGIGRDGFGGVQIHDGFV
nr:hypothetical protein [Tanacetum cinerariifolium]